MKNSLKIVLFALLVFAVTDSYAQKKKKAEDINPLVKECIDSKNYKIQAQSAHPNGWRSISLDSRYSVEVRGDSVFSYLPYFGRAYRLPYGGGEGLIFDAKITDYKVSVTKKGANEIKFRARTREDSYDFILTIFSNGRSSIRVLTENKQSIEFLGEMILRKKSNEI